jgi:membrane-associated HD superfamily phosphohydrolase
MMPKRQGNRKKKERMSAARAWAALKTIRARCVFVAILGTAFMIGMFVAAIAPERYNLKVGAIAFKTITASKDVVDEITTARRREDAARQVEPSYVPKDGVTDTVMSDLRSVFDELRTAQQYGQTLLSGSTEGAAHHFTQGELDYAKGLLTTISLADYQLTTLRLSLLKGQKLPSISDIIFAAVIVENEMKDLFGIQIKGLALDYEGRLVLSENAPASPLLKKPKVEN